MEQAFAGRFRTDAEMLENPKKKGPVLEPRTEPLGRNPGSMRSWYRYGDSNPGPVAENHVS